METISKHIDDNEEFWRLGQIISTFPKIHNRIRSDFVNLLEITEQHQKEPEKFMTLCRACIKSFFSLIEADIYYYNIFDKYKDYNDRHAFLDRFKKTFVQICSTWKREELQKEYFSTKLEDLKKLKEIRDKLIHPKEPQDFIDPSFEIFDKVRTSFKDYDEFVLKIMSNFFISTNLNLKF